MSNRIKIILFGILSEVIYISFFLIDLFRKQAGDTGLAISHYSFSIYIVILLLILFLFYFFVSRLELDKKTFSLTMVFFAIFNLSIIFIGPLTSIDIYTYIHTSRVLSIHHANPYIFSFDNFTNDSFYYVIKNIWSKFPTPYAPLFTLISAFITFIGQKSILLSLYLFKILFIFSNIISCYLIHKIFNNYKVTFLYAWNPLILFEVGVNGHNDILIILLILLSIFFIYKKQFGFKNYLLAFIFLYLSVMIKYTTIIFLPIIFILYFNKFKSIKDKFKVFIISLITFCILSLILYFPFWQGIETISRVINHTSNIYSYLFISPLITILATFFNFFKVYNPLQLGVMISKVLFVIFYLGVLIKIFIKKNVELNKIVFYFTISLAVFYFSFFTWLVPWYFTVLLVLLILSFNLSSKRYIFYSIHALTVYGLLHYIVLR